MSKEYLIGIDLGTTLAKCVIYDAAGAVLAEAQEAMRIRYPRSGEAEQDAEDFYTASCAPDPAVPAEPLASTPPAWPRWASTARWAGSCRWTAASGR